MANEEDDHDSDDNYLYSDENDDDGVYDCDDSTETINTANTMKSFGDKEKNYTVLSEKDIQQRQEDLITEVSNVLCLSRAAASILLLEYNWNVSKVHEAWFADEEKVRKTVGLIENTPPIMQNDEKSNRVCMICNIRFGCEVHDAGCGHSFCRLCWKDYITRSINNGAGCLNCRCPYPSCSVLVGQELIKKVVSGEDIVRYLRYLVRSYIEGNRNIKLCPAERCDYAVELNYEVSSCSGCEVTCVCTHSFCWKCMEEAHSPVDCDTASTWLSKIRIHDTKTMDWILANCKPCPGCKLPIEPKDTKVMDSSLIRRRMTCVCGFVFCWLCLSPWTGYVHACDQVLNEDEKRRDIVKSLYDGYTHYSEKWAANESLRKKAKNKLQELQFVYLEKLNNAQAMTSSQLSFITEAWQVIIECRRVLKWTYAYRYELPNGETKSQLSEYLQSEAESCLERLQDCAEKGLEVHHYADGYDQGFNVFCEKLSNLTNVTQDLFMKLVQELENGLLVDEGLRGNCTKRGISLTESETFIGPSPKKRCTGPLLGPK